MLKRIVSLILILPIVLALAYAPPAHAELAQVVVAQVQAGGDGAATQEFISIHNNSDLEVDISGWCLQNKANIKFACFTPPTGQAIYLPSGGYATIASQSFVDAKGISVTVTYTPTHSTSGSIVGSSDCITLLDKNESLVDQVNWASPLPAGYIKMRSLESMDPFVYLNTGTAADWFNEQYPAYPDSQGEYRQETTDGPDLCPNIGGVQSVLPALTYVNQQGDCLRYYQFLNIVELLPNPTGSDVGQEFIEFFNANDQPVDLSEYRLSVGISPDKSYALPATIIQPQSYGVIWNRDVNFTLVNSVGMVQLTSLDGSIVEFSAPYDSPKDGESWALIDSMWQYTNRPTPGAANKASADVLKDELVVDVTGNNQTVLKPCAANQERNPETNRCRLVATQSTTSTLTPCREGQERNVETNRCRNVATTSSQSAACKEGQERNPETNRCRNIVRMPDADYEVLGASSTNNESYWWYIAAAIIGLVLLAGSYAVWEWRREIAKLYVRLTGFVRSRK